MQWRDANRWLLGFLALLLAGSAPPSRAQASTLDQRVASELRVLASHAGPIFVGQITSIVRKQDVVEVTFRVDQPVAGTGARTCLLREWAGLWPAGQLRYTVGQRVLAFLHPASPAGFSTPVHGAEGLISVIVQGARAPQLLDIRRVAASVLRAPGAPLPTEANGAILLTDALALITPTISSQAPVPSHRLLPTRGTAPGEPGFGNSRNPVFRPIHEIPTAPASQEVLGGIR